MSRDQKPGKFKLVGNAPNPGRRIGDKLPDQPAEAANAGELLAPDTAAGSSKSSRLLLPLVFLLCCAVGGAGAVMVGLVEGLPR